MTRDEVLSKIVKELELHLGVKDVREEQYFVNDLHIDSLDVFELSMLFEEEFDIELSNKELVDTQTVKQLVDTVHLKVNARGEHVLQVR